MPLIYINKPYKVGLLQLRKLRFREVKGYAQGHTALRRRWDANPGLLHLLDSKASEPLAPSLCLWQ